MTGWRIGYGAGPQALIKAMAIVQSQSTSCPCSVSQAAVEEALNGPQEIVRERCRSFEARRNLVVENLNRIPGIACRTPEGAFYTFADCGGLIGRTAPDGTAIHSDTAFAEFLLRTANVAVVPGSAFGTRTLLSNFLCNLRGRIGRSLQAYHRRLRPVDLSANETRRGPLSRRSRSPVENRNQPDCRPATWPGSAQFLE